MRLCIAGRTHVCRRSWCSTCSCWAHFPNPTLKRHSAFFCNIECSHMMTSITLESQHSGQHQLVIMMWYSYSDKHMMAFVYVQFRSAITWDLCDVIRFLLSSFFAPHTRVHMPGSPSCCTSHSASCTDSAMSPEAELHHFSVQIHHRLVCCRSSATEGLLSVCYLN